MAGMLRRIALLVAATVCACVFVIARTPAQTPTAAPAAPVVQAPPAQPILDAAVKEAAASGKNVFVHFSASWCGWCHKLEKFLATPEGKLLDPYMIDVMLIVLETGPLKPLEHPGAAEIMKKWGGTGGIPFYVFLDGTGKVLSNANNMPNGGNIGYPANPVEVKAFDDVLAKGLPKLPADIRAKVIAYIAIHP
jgi:thiol-disulfide isomerase/thioredoxin